MKCLFREIDNAPLVIFRIFLGFLLACETFGAILTGWVKSNLVDVKFTFSHIGMEWLQPLPGNGMYYYFAAMGVLGLLVMIGFKYRLSIGLFTILWAGAYFMQKTSYNNHYYLLLLVCFIMFFLPAHRYASIDAKLDASIRKLTMPAWCSWIMIAQVSIVYFYATVAKFYPGWLNGSFTHDLLERSVSDPGLKAFMTEKWFYLFIAYAGIAFDMLVVPLLLYRRTRTAALIASVVFHIFNAITLQIGIFPFFALSFVVFFYPPEKMRSLFLKRKPQVTAYEQTDEGTNILRYVMLPYLAVQLLLPLRHHLIKGDVLWTDEGHRLSWRMMLRSRSGDTDLRVVDKKNGNQLYYGVNQDLTHKQSSTMETHPDMIWQMAQRIHDHYEKEGVDVAVYADTYVSVNNGKFLRLIDQNADLAAADWDHLFHCDWILLYDDEGKLVN
ncbi:HTTM domain-containing protein [Flavobacterium sp.]|uniref:HTTM domain-containing protein n=1 Tax=Flavobacterium sp. TaxID=239 RepID=UPI0040343640